MADEFDAEAFLAEFADEYRRYPNLRARTLAIFAGRLKPHLADRRAVEGLREATKLLRGYHATLRHKAISPSMNPGRQEELEAEVAAWLSVHTALAAAGEGE